MEAAGYFTWTQERDRREVYQAGVMASDITAHMARERQDTMSAATLRTLIVVVLLAHGIGHVLGILPAFGRRLSQTHSSQSWLLTSIMGDSFTSGLGIVLWSAGLVWFAAAAMGLAGWLLPYQWWERFAVTGALVSLLTLVLFWNGLPFLFPNKIGAIAVDITVLASLLWLRWPAAVLSG